MLNLIKKCYFLLFGLFIAPSYAVSLTPPHEPNHNNFYVCYQQCKIKYVINAPFHTYKKYQYVGCTLQTTPCDGPCNQSICKRTHKELQLFDWFDNYQLALNAFYRCAYS